MNDRNVLYGANPFFPIFNFFPINSYNDVIYDGFSMDIATKPVKIYLSVQISSFIK